MHLLYIRDFCSFILGIVSLCQPLLRRFENIVFTLLKTFCLKSVRQYEDVLVLKGTCVQVNKALSAAFV